MNTCRVLCLQLGILPRVEASEGLDSRLNNLQPDSSDLVDHLAVTCGIWLGEVEALINLEAVASLF